jgi:putative nucleotidyltransferase with HDIG domain
MPNALLEKINKKFLQSRIVNIVVLIFVAALIFIIIVLPISFRPTPSLLDIGDVAFQDIYAPRSFSYISEYLTGIAQDKAEKTVTPVYLPTDSAISRKQIVALYTILSYISTTRIDTFSDNERKIEDIQAIEVIAISENTANTLVNLSDERWDSIQAESLYVLEQVMRNSIREDQVSSIQRDLSPQIGYEFNEQETSIISEIVSQLIIANSLYSNEKSAEAISAARESIDPISKNYAAGEIIINSGEVVDALKWETLQELGYTEPKNKIYDYVSASLLIIVLVGMNFLYVERVKRTGGHSIKGLPIITFLFLLFLLSARLVIPNHTILPYLFPIAAFGLTISSVFDYETGLIGSLSLSILAAYNQLNSIDLALYYFIPSAISIFILGRGRRINIFFISGLALSLSGSAIVISYRLLNSFLDVTGAGTLIGAAFVNGIGSISLALLFQYLLSLILGKTTALQLMDLSRPDHPLLQELLTKAPGTYQHSLQVANLAEQAAREIKGDALLTRIGALYHDVGKSLDPSFFIENQHPGHMDTHEDMDPVISAATIIQHVTDGIKLANKYRLPLQIQAFILEHHGTTITRYQYNQAAVDAGGENFVEKSLFQYPGPIPQSKETALLMLADGSEARMRSETPENKESISAIVEESINYYVQNGQLDNADLTLSDIQKVKNSFTRTFNNSYHHRIKYPGQELNNHN